MRRLCVCLLVTSAILWNNNSLGQNVIIEITVAGRTFNGGSCTNSGHVTLENMSGGILASYSPSGTQFFGATYTYEADLPNGWQGKISASGSLSGFGCSGGASIPVKVITFNSSSCNSYSYSAGSLPAYDISLTVSIHAPIGDLSVDNSYKTCGINTVNLSLASPQHPGTTFDWQVGETSATFYTFRSGAPSAITATVDELNLPIFTTSKYAPRYVRAVGTNCPSNRITSHISLEFLPAYPIVTVVETNPDCFNSSDGELKVSITSGDPAYYNDFTLDVIKQGLEFDIQLDLVDEFNKTVSGFNYGTYYIKVRYKADSTCNTTIPKVLTNPQQLTASLQPSDFNDFQISCNGASDGTIQVSASGGTGALSYQWSPSVSSSSFASGLAAGSYSITVKDANNCPVILSTTLSQPTAKPTVAIFSTGGVSEYDLSCAAATDGKLVANGSSQVSGAILYQWTSGPAINTWPDLGAGTYTVTMTDANGCTDSKSKTLTVRPDLNFNISQVSAIECRDQPDGELEVTSASITNATLPYSYSWSSGETSPSIMNKLPGTYSVTVTDAKGCKKLKSATLDNPIGYSVTINPLSDYNGSKISCVGEDDGALGTIVKDLATNNIVTASHYAWFKDNSPYSSGAFLTSISGLTAGTYKAEITYGANCKAQSVIVLSDPVPVTPGINVTSTELHKGFHVSCPGATNGSLLAIATGGSGSMNYSWDTSPVTNGASLTGIGAGTYTVTATDANGCSASLSKTINDPPAINPSISIETNYNGQAIKCHNGQDAKLKTSATGGAGGYTYLWDTGVLGADLNNVGAGTYTVTVTDANSCTETKSQTLVNPTQVTGSILIMSNYHGQAIKCYNDLNGELQASGAGGAGSYTYAWNTGATTATLSAIGAGTYVVIVKDINQCSSSPANQTLTNPAPVAADIAVTSDYHGAIISCDGAQDGSLAASATGGTGIFTYTWNTGDSGADLGGLPKGTYEVTVTDQNGCFGKKNIVIDDPAPVSAFITAISNYNGYGIKCIGDNNGFMEASGTGGTGVYSFLWQNTSETTYKLSDIGEGTYSVTVTDVNGCHDIASADIIEPAELSLSATQKVDPKCFDGNDGTITVLATGGVGGYEYALNLLGWQTPSQFSGLGATQYALKAKDANGCITNILESLGQPTQITITFQDVEPAFCADPRGKATAVVTGGTGSNYAFEWRNTSNVVFDTDATINNLSAGAYTLKVYDENNCIAENAIGIVSTDGPAAEVEEMIPAKCSYSADGGVTLKVTGNSPFTIAWPDGQTTIQGENLLKGSYLVTITDTYGCTSVKQVDVTAPVELSINLIETTMPSCTGFSDGKLKVAAQGGTPIYGYSWNGVNGEERTSLATGYHSVKVTDANGCEAENTFPLDEPTLLELTLLSRQLPSCNGNCNGSIELEASGSNGGYSYSWNVGRTEAKALEICAADHTVTVTDAKGCALERTYNLGQPEILQSKLVKNTRPSCHSDCDGSLEIEAFGGNGGYTYLWTEGSLSSVIENICAGDHLITITDSKGCQETNKIFVLNQPEPVQARVVREQMPDCHGDCNGSIEVQGYGGNGNYQYQWIQGPATAALANICSGDHFVTVTDAKNCILNDKAITLSQPDLLQVKLAQMLPPICHEGCDGKLSIEALGGNGNYQYTWSTGATSSLAEGLCVQQYNVTVRDSKACEATGAFTVENTPQLVIELGDPLTLCVGQKHILDAGEQWTTYKWTSNNGFSSNTQKVTIQDPGLYQVEVINEEGCTAQDDFLLETSTDLLKAEFFLTAKAMVGDTVVMVDVSWPLPENIDWEYPAAMERLGDLGEIIYGKFIEPGIYQIKLKVSLGECRDEMSKTISILNGEPDNEDGRLGYEKFVRNFELYPNPNNGDFDVRIELAEESPFTLSVWSVTTSLNMGKWKDSGQSSYVKHIDLRPLMSGQYVLRLDHARGHEMIRFMIH